MSKIRFHIEGMSCEHCVKAVKNAVGAIDGVTGVEVSLEENTAIVECGETPPELIKSEIEDQGYDVTGFEIL